MPAQYSIVAHPSEPRVLLERAGDGWTLPAHEAEEAHAIRQVMRERFGLETTLLGTFAGRYLDGEREEAERVFALETHGAADPLPRGAQWADREALVGSRLAVPEHWALLERWFREAEEGAVPPERPPWARLGWYDTAAGWIGERLAALGTPAEGAVEQLHARAWSTVLRVPTRDGPVYFKAVAEAFAYEPPLTEALAALLPTRVPRVLAADLERRWLLLADAGTSLRAVMRAEGKAEGKSEGVGERDAAWYEAMLVQFARFQRATAPEAERLAALGCPDHRLARLPALYHALLADRAGLLVGQAGGLSEDDYAALRNLQSEVAALCAALGRVQVPEALNQEDCNPGHAVPTPGGEFLYFDWGDTSVAHPFFSLMMALRWARLVLEFDAATLDRLRDAYLAEWTAYAPLERLIEAYQAARRLGLLNRALSWHHYVAHMEPGARWEYEDAAPYYLGLFLRGE